MIPQTSTGRMSQTAYILLHTNPGPLRLPGTETSRRNDVGAMRRAQGLTTDEAIDRAIAESGRRMSRAELQDAIGQGDLYKRLSKRVGEGTLVLTRVAHQGMRGGNKACYYALPGMEKQLEDMG